MLQTLRLDFFYSFPFFFRSCSLFRCSSLHYEHPRLCSSTVRFWSQFICLFSINISHMYSTKALVETAVVKNATARLVPREDTFIPSTRTGVDARTSPRDRCAPCSWRTGQHFELNRNVEPTRRNTAAFWEGHADTGDARWDSEFWKGALLFMRPGRADAWNYGSCLAYIGCAV